MVLAKEINASFADTATTIMNSLCDAFDNMMYFIDAENTVLLNNYFFRSVTGEPRKTEKKTPCSLSEPLT